MAASSSSSSTSRTRKTSLGRRPAGFDIGTDAAGRGSARLDYSSSSQSASASAAAAATSSSSSGPLASASSSARRQALLYGAQEDQIVLDIGTRCTKAGFTGEARPRVVLDSVRAATRPSESLVHDRYGRGEDIRDDMCLWTPDILRSRDPEERARKRTKLKAQLTLLLREVYSTHLMIEPKSRGVVLLHGPLMPNVVRKAICDVLFGNLQVPSISFSPTHLLSTFATGRLDGLVIDVGHHESTLVPIYFGRPLIPTHLRTTPRAGRRLQRRLRALLLQFGYYYPPHTSSSLGSSSTTTTSSSFIAHSASAASSTLSNPGAASMRSTAAPSRRTAIPEKILTEGFLQDIAAKALLVGDPIEKQDMHISLDYYSSNFDDDDGDNESSDQKLKEAYFNQLRDKYDIANRTRAADLTMQVPAPSRPAIHPAQQPSTLSLAGAHTTQEARGSIVVPGWIRERACEVFFEPGDEDESSLVELVLEALVKLPIDARIALARSIIVVGGAAMVPNFAHRLRVELVRALENAEESLEGTIFPAGVALSMAHVGPLWRSEKKEQTQQRKQQQEEESKAATTDSAPAAAGDESFQSAHEDEEGPTAMDESFVSTIDAITAPADREQELTEATNRSLSIAERKRYYRFAPLSTLAHHIAVLNDHAPRIASDGSAVGGTAPSFPLQLVPWIGASLMGSLRFVDSAQIVLRETWEQAQADQREIALKSLAGDQQQQGMSLQAGATELLPASPPSASLASRPGYGAQRGSFLGVVHGLDLGSYGPLSARQRFGSGLGSPPAR